MAKSNGAILSLRRVAFPDFTSLLAFWDKDWLPIALCVAALAFWILFTVGLFMWSDPSVNWDDVLSQARLALFDI
jgi:hypothetical protein